MAEQLQISGLQVSSAGTRAVVGHPMHESALAVLEGLGGTGEGFVARQLTPQIAAGADLVLTMTREHRDAVLGLAPQKLRRTFTVAEAARIAEEAGARDIAELAELRSRIAVSESFDIIDPIGRSFEVFETVGDQIAALLEPILVLCKRSAGITT